MIQFLDRDGCPRPDLRGRAATAYKNVVLDAGRWASGHPGRSCGRVICPRSAGRIPSSTRSGAMSPKSAYFGGLLDSSS